MMKTEFPYRPNVKMTSLLSSVAIAICVIVVPIVYPFSIGAGTVTLVPYPYSMYLLIAIGVLLLISSVSRHNKEKKFAREARPIIIEDGKVSYPYMKRGVISEESFLISEITSAKADKDEETFTVKTADGQEREFQVEYFGGLAQYREFRDALGQ